MRVLIAESHPEVRSALRLLLENSDVKYTTETANPEDLGYLLKEVKPDILLLEWELMGIRSAKLISEIIQQNPELYVIVLSSRPQVRRFALESGAEDFICKSDPPEKLVAALNRCFQGIRKKSQP